MPLAQPDNPTSRTPRMVWHASRHDIERPTLDGRIAGDNHANSGLGLFCATAPCEYLGSFGPWVHEMTLAKHLRVMRMGITDLRDLGRDEERQWFIDQGRALAEDYDIIELVELGGRVDQVIVLHDRAIVSSTRLSQDQFKQVCVRDPGAARKTCLT